MSVDVIIVNYNAGNLLIDSVRSALTQQVTRVLVIDNDSHDTSLAQLSVRVSDPRLEIIRNVDNLGFAAACNIGIQASSAEFLLFLNPDGLLTPDALESMLTALKAQADIGMAGGLLCNPDGSEQPGGRRVFPTPRRAFVRAFGLAQLGRWFPGLFSDFLLHQQALPESVMAVEAISGACMLVKRQAIDAVGLWDEKYFLHCEDLDWCMRFRRAGWQIVFVPDALVFHVKGACSRQRLLFVEWHKHRGMLRFYHKFFRKQYPGVLWWLVVAGVWTRFSLMSIFLTALQLKNTLSPSHPGVQEPVDDQRTAAQPPR